MINTMEIGATRDRSNLAIEPTSGSGRLTARPVIKRPTPPVIIHWDEVINMSQSAPDNFFPSHISILFPLFHFSFQSMLTICRSSGGCRRSKQRIRVLSSAQQTQTPLYTSIFPSPWLYPCFTCTHLNPKEHISQHKWVKQVILKHSWAGKEGCLNSTDFHLVLRFLLRIFVAFYVYAQHFSIIDCSMNIPQQKCRGSNGCVRLTSAGKNIRANQLSA